MSSMMPFGQPKPQKQDNFSFRQKRAGLITGRPTFTNRFSSLQPERAAPKRKPLPVFGSLRGTDLTSRHLHELSENQHHYLKERGITLPRMHVGESTTDAESKWLTGDDESNSSDSETDYYTIWECNGIDSEVQIKSPGALKNNQMIYPWTLLENVKNQATNNKEVGKEEIPTNFKYGSLPMCYKTIPENEAMPNEDDQEPVKQNETKRLMLNFDRTRILANKNKRHTLDRITVSAQQNIDPDISEGTTGSQREAARKSSTLPRSSVRIRPILKNRIENIYTDLISSSALANKGPQKLVTWNRLNSESDDTTDEEHNYEQIRDADLIQNWEAKNNISSRKIGKKLPGLEKGLKFNSYENAGFIPDLGLDKSDSGSKKEPEMHLNKTPNHEKEKSNNQGSGTQKEHKFTCGVGVIPEIERLKGLKHKNIKEEMPNEVPITLIL